MNSKHNGHISQLQFTFWAIWIINCTLVTYRRSAWAFNHFFRLALNIFYVSSLSEYCCWSWKCFSYSKSSPLALSRLKEVRKKRNILSEFDCCCNFAATPFQNDVVNIATTCFCVQVSGCEFFIWPHLSPLHLKKVSKYNIFYALFKVCIKIKHNFWKNLSL